MTDTLPVTRPATALGWAPPFTDTPDEISARREAAAEAHLWHRQQTTAQRREAEAWDTAIRDGLAELGAA